MTKADRKNYGQDLRDKRKSLEKVLSTNKKDLARVRRLMSASERDLEDLKVQEEEILGSIDEVVQAINLSKWASGLLTKKEESE